MPVSTVYPREYKYSITGLIEELKNLRDKHGEIPVCTFDDLHGIIPLGSVWISDEDEDFMQEKRVVLG